MLTTNPAITLVIKDKNNKQPYLKTLIGIDGCYYYNFFTRTVANDFLLSGKLPVREEIESVLKVRSKLISNFMRTVLSQNDFGEYAVISLEEYVDSVSHFLTGLGDRKFIPVLKTDITKVTSPIIDFVDKVSSTNKKISKDFRGTHSMLSSTVASLNQVVSSDSLVRPSKVLKVEDAKDKENIVQFVKDVIGGGFDGAITDIYVGGKLLSGSKPEPQNVDVFSLTGGIYQHLI